MARIKRGAAVASMFMLIAVVFAACRSPYSTPPPATSTINATSLFETPVTPDITMSDVANFGTLTALASSGTPQAIATETPSVGTQDLSAIPASESRWVRYRNYSPDAYPPHPKIYRHPDTLEYLRTTAL